MGAVVMGWRLRARRISGVLFALSLLVVGSVSAAPVPRQATLSGDGFEGGDPNARGRAVLRIAPSGGRVCFRISYRRMIEPTYGSVHSGSMESGGPLEVTLFNGDKGGRPSPIEGCAEDLPADVLREIKEHPSRFYVDINQHVYADSALRGPLMRP